MDRVFEDIRLGLRVDVDTLRGTREGVPRLLHILKARELHASFFFSVGPDNMGRNLWHLLNPDFLKKMWRSKAPSLYGWDVLLMGTAWTGPEIGPRAKNWIRAAADAGHELGLHAWDHFTWQHKLDELSREQLLADHKKAHQRLAEFAGRPPLAAAAPGWRVNETMLELRDQYHYRYASDCRGHSLFRPELGERTLSTPQIPTTLPTFDELVGARGVTPENYNSTIITLINPGALNVYTVHAEVEGLAFADLFDRLLAELKSLHIHIVPLGSLLPENPAALPSAPIQRGIVTGRAGWVAVQG